MTYMIEAKGLRKQYGDFTAVDGASFNINAGEIVDFISPTGRWNLVLRQLEQ